MNDAIKAAEQKRKETVIEAKDEALRMKRMETHQVFDSFWKERGMSRTQGYKWMAKKLRLSEELAHIGGFEMDRCQKLIRLCEKERNKEKKKETA